MSEIATFILGAVGLLATPGPTNTLLVTAGAANGFRRSLGLLWGECFGYLLAITFLMTAAGPALAIMPKLGLALRIAVCLYLLYLSATLWRNGVMQTIDDRPISIERVFVTTVLNPKAAVFAFVVVPSGSSGDPLDALPWLCALSVMIGVIGTCWIAAGAALQSGLGKAASSHNYHRAGAIALLLFAVVIAGSAITTA